MLRHFIKNPNINLPEQKSARKVAIKGPDLYQSVYLYPGAGLMF